MAAMLSGCGSSCDGNSKASNYARSLSTERLRQLYHDMERCYKSAFRDVTSRSPQAVDLDFAGVTHIGSAGIGKLLVFYKDLGIRNAKLTLVRVPTAIHHLLCEMKLDTLFVVQQGR